MATIGQQLLIPESGWKRYEQNSPYFSYLGTWVSQSSSASSGNASVYAEKTGANKLKFDFFGTKLRILGVGNPNYHPDIKVVIDGAQEKYGANVGELNKGAILQYEKTGLPLRWHSVEVYNNGEGYWWYIDAIDIDDTGSLEPNNKVLFSSDSNYISIINTKLNENIALNKPATASQSYPDATLTPDKAVDGKTRLNGGRGWTTTGTFSTSDWWQVDLKRTYLIGKYRIYNDAQASGSLNTVYNTSYDVLVSVDGNQYTKIKSVSGVTSSQWIEIELPSPVLARYIKLTNMSAVGTYLSIGEFEVYEIDRHIKIMETVNEQNFLRHGMETSITGFGDIFTKKVYVNSNSNSLGSCKVFKQPIDTSKVPIKKVLVR